MGNPNDIVDIPRHRFEALAAAARRTSSEGLSRCSSGNISCRIDPHHMLVKASRFWMCDLTADQIAVCRISDGAHLSGPKPSVETGFHSGVLRERPDLNVVLHFQSPAATTLACRSPETINFHVIPEIPYYIGPIAVVPWILAGTPDLAAAVVSAMRTHNLVVLTNHGLVTAGKTFDETIQRAVFFELACDVILRAGPAIRPLGAPAAAELEALSKKEKGV